MDHQKKFFYHHVVIYIAISALVFNYNGISVHGQSLNNSCKMLSRNDIPTFCEEILGNSTLYYHLSDTNSSCLLNITSLQTQSPCLDLMKRYLCYYYHPVCNKETGDLVQFCTSNCEVLNDNSSCSDLVINVTRELESVGQTFPDVECLMAEAGSETDAMCLDISNGNISIPVPTTTIQCAPIPLDNTCFTQLTHTYFAPEIYQNAEEFQREFRIIISPLPATEPCRAFFSSLSCALVFPSCIASTNKLQPICQHLCPRIDALISRCVKFVNTSAIPFLNSVFARYNCSDPTSYFNVPLEYIDLESCNSFIALRDLPGTVSNTGDGSSSSSSFPLGLSETNFIITVASLSTAILTSCIVVSICVTVCIRKKQKWKNDDIIRETVIEVGIPSQYQYLNPTEYVNKDVTSDDGVRILLKQVETQFGDCLIPTTSLSKNVIIGKGEFGIVYRGHLINDEDNTSQIVAIKTVRSLERWLSEAADFMSESTIMAYFDHPNVLRMIGLCVDTEIFSIDIVLPFMANGDLRAFLKDHRVEQGNISSYPEGLNEVALINMCMDIAKGMEYLASKRFVHRDLAARNCMVDEHLCVKVADFGLAKDIYSSEYYRMNSNTKVPVKWMSPESLLDGFFNEKTDVWSYGVTCWEVFSLGRLPYAGIENQKIIRILKNGYRLEKPELCSDKMYELVMALCWEEVPTNRLSFKDIVQTLDHVLTDADVHTQTPYYNLAIMH